jgi:hypothetical protein
MLSVRENTKYFVVELRLSSDFDDQQVSSLAMSVLNLNKSVGTLNMQ